MLPRSRGLVLCSPGMPSAPCLSLGAITRNKNRLKLAVVGLLWNRTQRSSHHLTSAGGGRKATTDPSELLEQSTWIRVHYLFSGFLSIMRSNFIPVAILHRIWSDLFMCATKQSFRRNNHVIYRGSVEHFHGSDSSRQYPRDIKTSGHSFQRYHACLQRDDAHGKCHISVDIFCWKKRHK